MIFSVVLCVNTTVVPHAARVCQLLEDAIEDAHIIGMLLDYHDEFPGLLWRFTSSSKENVEKPFNAQNSSCRATQHLTSSPADPSTQGLIV